jgi:Xaa-Pro aminopeptidase
LQALIAGIAQAPLDVGGPVWLDLIDPATVAADRERLIAGVAEERLRRCREEPARDRIARLRRWLRERRLTGFVVPRADAHQGETVAPCSERLRWLSGFSGSAGNAVVLAREAALFVDGRYTLQAAAEVDGALFAIRHATAEPMASWIAQHLPRRGRLGYDPWLHTPRQVDALVLACAQAGGRAVAVEANPIDALWDDRPAEPIAPVVLHPERYAGATAREKCRDIGAVLKRDRQAAAVLSAPDSIAWLLNVRGGDLAFSPVVLSFAIIDHDGGVVWFVDQRKLTPAVVDALGDGIEPASPDSFAAALDRLAAAGARVRIDPDGTPDWVVRRLRRGGGQVVAEGDPCVLAKAVKNPVEQDGLRAAHVRDGAALCRFLAWLARTVVDRPVGEIEAAEWLQDARATNPLFRGLSFRTISAAGPNGAIVHYQPSAATSRILESGSLYLVDSGAQYLDGTTDVTRTVAIGTPTAEMRQRFTLVLKGHIALATVRFPKDTSGSQLDAFARRALWSHGLDYDHGTGHGVGCYLNVHEGPQRISKLPNRTPLQPGMLVSNEPGYYRAGAYGIRIENLVLVVPIPAPADAEQPLFGFETLTLAPIDRTLIEPSLLEAAEIAWVDTYHHRVCAKLAPLLDPEARTWLEAATTPLGE